MRNAALCCAICAAVLASAAGGTGPPSGTVLARVLVSPLSVTVVVPAEPPKVGRDFWIRAEVANAGSSAVQNVAVTLLAPQALLLRDAATQVLPQVRAAEIRSVRWDACATTTGGYVVMARATAGPFTAESPGQLLQLTAAKRPSC